MSNRQLRALSKALKIYGQRPWANGIYATRLQWPKSEMMDANTPITIDDFPALQQQWHQNCIEFMAAPFWKRWYQYYTHPRPKRLELYCYKQISHALSRLQQARKPHIRWLLRDSLRNWLKLAKYLLPWSPWSSSLYAIANNHLSLLPSKEPFMIPMQDQPAHLHKTLH